jgi:hypothetical protein
MAKQGSPRPRGGVAGVNPVLAAYGAGIIASVLISSGKKYLDSGRREAKKSRNIPLKQNPKLKQKMSVDQLSKNVVKQINPNYGGNGTKQNCRRCTLTYEMRRRGYDVKATSSNYASGQTIKGLRKTIGVDKKTKFDSIWGEHQISTRQEFLPAPPQKKADLIFSTLRKQPDGSRGELAFSWVMGGGHSIAYEIVGKKPVVFDTQNGKVYKSAKDLSELTPVMLDVAHTRLDNKPLNEDLIRRWSTNA